MDEPGSRPDHHVSKLRILVRTSKGMIVHSQHGSETLRLLAHDRREACLSFVRGVCSEKLAINSNFASALRKKANQWTAQLVAVNTSAVAVS